MATDSSILAWRIQPREESGGYSPWGHKELDMTEAIQHACMLLILHSQVLLLYYLFLLHFFFNSPSVLAPIMLLLLMFQSTGLSTHDILNQEGMSNLCFLVSRKSKLQWIHQKLQQRHALLNYRYYNNITKHRKYLSWSI